MKILLVHNRYQFLGGEDEVYERERELLRSKGHEIVEYFRDNREIANYSFVSSATLGFRTIWAWDSYRELKELIKRAKPDVAHFHNTFPLISPAGYSACTTNNVPVVQTLHNPRLLCPAATLYRNGKVCQECSGRTFAWPAVWHGCYQDSRVRSTAVSSMLAIHRGLGTWMNKVHTYIASTEFYRQKFVGAGIPEEKISVKPHFVPNDPECKDGDGEYALFVGRLAPEKGIATLISAWRQIKSIPLYVRGDGPWSDAIAKVPNVFIKQVPRLDRAELFNLIKRARFLVWPSEGFYETFGLIAIEAFACGVPVIASRIGVMQEIVRDGVTGLHFSPGDPDDLAAKVRWAWEHPNELQNMGRNARAEYQREYTPDNNYQLLLKIYENAWRGVSALTPNGRGCN